ncbi:protein translocase subunit SecF [Candidatus Methylopumilus universalis]|jgi:preprotein translocase subunit SecF|uniref:Protein-export membrane protein SecF n=1 Tax=Candidatus Methylopumilus universalis TaxID=2588536 RepID=A0AAX1F0S5_9PROT|nr:protein translocase subunit SecF [Candidatus Methylopumilus universalis]MBP7855804.1 protein translocase subunit SecF [Candidatus Methylopumilus sp.]GDX53629.1 protein-export membrane protein SecF [Methylophilaceae bacterium]MBW0155543.1 protein translocase subunit SecF [Candidatus Methylopumilus sp.]MCF8161968.1 protein translocase subunit SecF [Candidatus Methylopumilus sp.]QDC41450.1 protein translocase subunit SecF [Candidatus Methylopumilus universalis]
MELFRIKKDIPFMSYGRLTTTISLITFIISIVFLSFKGLNLGVDFTGGTLMEVSYSHPADIDKIRQVMDKIDLKDTTVQNFGTSKDVLIRLPIRQDLSIAQLSEKVSAALIESDKDTKIQRVESVGSQVGEELYANGALALLLVCFGIIAYLALRFEWRFAVAAVIANMHDVIIILGFFAFFQWEFNLTVLAAILAVLGYSVNESVVVFDRVRENFKKMRKANVVEVIDNAITRTMSRTVITHLMTQTMVCSMLFFGGETLHNFALALTIGILFGIYSSVLVACPVAMWLGVSQRNLGQDQPKEDTSQEINP